MNTVQKSIDLSLLMNRVQPQRVLHDSIENWGLDETRRDAHQRSNNVSTD